jgi:hypothetical protein
MYTNTNINIYKPRENCAINNHYATHQAWEYNIITTLHNQLIRTEAGLFSDTSITS